MNTNDLYAFAWDYLVKQSGDLITKEELEAYPTVCDTKDDWDLKDAFKTLCPILCDYNSKSNVIGWDKRKSIFQELLFNFDYKKVLEVYKTGENLLEEFAKHFPIKNIDSPRNIWRGWSKGIISGAKYLNKFKDANELRSLYNMFATNDIVLSSLPLHLEKSIYGMGFAIACNWLKELNYSCYAKPDTHINKILQALELTDKDATDYSRLEVIRELAKNNNVTPYALDKVLWLICSGNYYRQEKKLVGSAEVRRDKFINAFLES